MFSFSPALTMGVWLGNPDTTILKNGTSSLGSPIVASVMEYAHKEVYAPEGKWASGNWFTQPAGIQKVGIEMYPAWWSKTQGQANAKLTFDRVSMFKATACTPEGAKVVLDVIRSVDPVTKNEVFSNVPLGYDATKEDNVHQCGAGNPNIGTADVESGPGDTWTIEVAISSGSTFGLDTSGVTITARGTNLTVTKSGNTYKATYQGKKDPSGEISVTATDQGYYSTTRGF